VARKVAKDQGQVSTGAQTTSSPTYCDLSRRPIGARP